MYFLAFALNVLVSQFGHRLHYNMSESRMKTKAILIVAVVSQLVIGCSLRPDSSSGGVSAVGLTATEWASLSQPGPSHKLLDIFVGEWDTRISFWSAPKADPQISRGTSSIRWIVGNRFLQEDFRGRVVDEDLQGLGLMGFDNGSRQFKTVWIDSLNTALAVSYGRYVPDRNLFEMSSEVYDPLIGGTKTVRSAITIISPDKYSFSMIDTAPSGEDFTSMEILYTRKR